MTNPMVSVWMMTYNQVSYIAEAMEGVLMQKTTFPVRLVIGEDGSTDGTRAIIEDYCTRYPGRILLLPDEGNLGMMPNMARTMNACRGARYVAMCEGDDYWIDEYKLQKQVDFMEAHPDCAMCFHAVEHRFADPRRNFVQHDFDGDTWVGLKEVVVRGGTFISMPSILFRGVDADLPDWHANCLVGDYPLTIHLALRGRSRYMDDPMAVYRRGAIGSWTQGWTWKKQRNLIFSYNKMFVAINRQTRGRHLGLIAKVLFDTNWGLLKAAVYATVAQRKQRV